MSDIDYKAMSCGCLPDTPKTKARREKMISDSVSIEYLWERGGDMPVIEWNSTLELWLKQRGDEADELRDRGVCCLPWVVLRSLPAARKKSDLLYYAQGPVNSCMAHSDAFAYQSTLLSALIAKGAPLDYRPVNPFCTYWYSDPGNWDGRTVSDMAATANEAGHWPCDLVGEDNTTLPEKYNEVTPEAKNFQSGVAYLTGTGDELVNQIVACCRADLSVSFGNSLAVRGCKIDKNGVNVAVLGGRWFHATSFVGYRKIGNTIYLFWVNSHGEIYLGSTEGDPPSGCWMPLDDVARFCSSMSVYGAPYVHFVEGTYQNDWALRTKLKLEFPDGFKR